LDSRSIIDVTETPARPSDLRVQNSRTLLRLVRDHEPCSKADLARLSGLSAPTVAAAVADLSALGLVEPAGEGPSSGGRPPELLRFRPEHRLVAAADIGGTRLRLMIANLSGVPVAERKCIIPPDAKTPEAICVLLYEQLLSACAEAGITAQKILHLTVGAPGITDVERGMVLSAPNLDKWTQVPLRQMLEQLCGIPVTVENDVNLAAIGEHWRGIAVGVKDFILIAIGTGIGSGIFLGGRLYRGAQWSAGEIGYFPVAGMAPEMPDQNIAGQLERVIGGAGIERMWRERLKQSSRAADASLMKLRASRILDLANDLQDPTALTILKETARLLTDAIVNTMLILNPSLIVLGGGVGSHPSLQREVERLLQPVRFPRPAICTSTLDTHAQLYGAIAMALEACQAKLVC
jgi:glucokinase